MHRETSPPGRHSASLAEAVIAERPDAVLALRNLVDQLAGADLPKGCGRSDQMEPHRGYRPAADGRSGR
jgi:hypothetical protein